MYLEHHFALNGRVLRKMIINNLKYKKNTEKFLPVRTPTMEVAAAAAQYDG